MVVMEREGGGGEEGELKDELFKMARCVGMIISD
jgi:hypothetical protein